MAREEAARDQAHHELTVAIRDLVRTTRSGDTDAAEHAVMLEERNGLNEVLSHAQEVQRGLAVRLIELRKERDSQVRTLQQRERLRLGCGFTGGGRCIKMVVTFTPEGCAPPLSPHLLASNVLSSLPHPLRLHHPQARATAEVVNQLHRVRETRVERELQTLDLDKKTKDLEHRIVDVKALHKAAQTDRNRAVAGLQQSLQVMAEFKGKSKILENEIDILNAERAAKEKELAAKHIQVWPGRDVSHFFLPNKGGGFGVVWFLLVLVVLFCFGLVFGNGDVAFPNPEPNPPTHTHAPWRCGGICRCGTRARSGTRR